MEFFELDYESMMQDQFNLETQQTLFEHNLNNGMSPFEAMTQAQLSSNLVDASWAFNL